MKLGKSLIITGLLFSSILGSVNVGSITAMAAEIHADQIDEKQDVSIHFIDENGADITKEVTDAGIQPTVKVAKGSTTLPLSSIDMLHKYTITDTTDPTIGAQGVTVKVKKVAVEPTSKITVKIVFMNGTTVVGSPDYTIEKNNENDKVSKEDITVPDNYSLLDDSKQENIIKTVNGDVTSYTVTFNVEAKSTNTHNDKNKGKKPSRHSGYTSQRVRISFIDQDGNEVGFQQLKGKVSSDKKITAPNGYSFVNANEATIKFDKSSNKDIKLNVTKNKPVSTMEEGIVTTNSGDFKHLYTIEGKDITNRGLSGDSKWYTDQYATINGEKMFRVATNEWVKATDVYK